MDLLDLFAFFVMLVIAIAVVVSLLWLGKLPGDVARRRGHPQASAITACGWLGILTLGLLWPVALIWAYTNVESSPNSTKQNFSAEQFGRLEDRIRELEKRVGGTEQ